MPEFDSTTQTKISLLRANLRKGEPSIPFELCKVLWPSPDGTVWYASTDPDPDGTTPLPSEVGTVQKRLIADNLPEMFLPLQMGDELGDETVDLKFWDSDGVVGDLITTHGEGVKCELYYWFPQVDLLLRVWHGHLRNEEDAGPNILPIKAVQGFRSTESQVPGRAHYEYCSAVFGGLLETQAQIDEHACPYNLHIGGGVGNNDPGTSQPWTYCDRLSTASCTARGVSPLYHLSHATSIRSVANGQTHGPTLTSTSFGNQTNLKEPVQVVLGEHRVRSMPVLAYRRDLNNNTPSHGWFQSTIEACHGPVDQISDFGVTIGGTRKNDPFHYSYRLGQFGQGAVYTLTTHGFSGIALFHYAWGWIDPTGVDPKDVQGDARIRGLNNIRVYTDDSTYTSIYSTNPAWHIARVLCDKIWGYGLDYARLDIDSFIEAAEWCDEYVTFTDAFGGEWNHQRASSNAVLSGKKVQQQIEDLCRSARLSLPFVFNGKIHVVPLRELTSDELAACPVFTDEGDDPNIAFSGDVSTLRFSRQSSIDLANRIECTFNDAANDWKEVPLRPVEDVDAQLAAGRVVGDQARKINAKKFSLLGSTFKAQSTKLAWGLLDLGEHDSGGLMNNCSAKFSIWYLDSLDLHPAKVIKIESARTTRYGFEYFRIRSIKRSGDLHVELQLQAYNPTYMATFEVAGDPPDDDPQMCPPGWHWDPILMACVEDTICTLEFGTPAWEDGVLTVPIEPCV